MEVSTGPAIDVKARLAALAAGEGFPLVRFAAAATLVEARHAAHDRHAAGLLDGMGWITEEWLDRATAPGAFLDGAKSVMVVGLPYGGSAPPAAGGGPRGRVARYAQGRDYHRVFEKRLRRLVRTIREELGAGARATVDYGPLLERPLAAVSGMGWLGKSTMLLVPGVGPWVMLGAVATTIEVKPDRPLAKSCGTCERCITACPTGAIDARGNVVDARRCISYHTIENRGWIPVELRAQFGNWVFGCDACLDACPVGFRAGPGDPALAPVSREAAAPDLVPLIELDEEAFLARFQGRPIMRAKRAGMARNACIALGNIGTAEELPALVRALDDPSPVVRGHAAWAIGELAGRGMLTPGGAADAAATLSARAAAEPDTTTSAELQAAAVRCEVAAAAS